ncbi:MAG: hypothetical protein RL329_2162 [Bacteroidota bacterium]|jgi:hypothetical protein
MNGFKPLLLLLPFWCITTINAQQASIFGFLTDSLTGETLVGAHVLNYELDEQQERMTLNGTSTNTYGFYSLPVKKGMIQLEFSAIGYQPKIIILDIQKDTTVHIPLNIMELQTVEINASKFDHVTHGMVQLPIERLKSVPTLAGEADVLKALALTPGVSTGTEGTSGLYVRGGTPDQNLILLDGATVYNTSHLFGFLSVFNPEALKSVSLLKGNFPARYGGRLSSVVDVTMKEGNNQERKRQASIGIISSNLSWEGPIEKGKSSYMIAGRSAYAGLLSLPSYSLFKSGKLNYYTNFGMYDFNAKVNFELDSRSKIFVSGYIGNDIWVSQFREGKKINKWNLSWGNQTASVRYHRILKNNLFSDVLLNFNRFNYEVTNEYQGDANLQDLKYTNSSAVQDVAFKNKWQLVLPTSEIQFGVEVNTHQFKPNFITVRSGVDTSSLNQIQKPVSAALYAEINKPFLDKFQFNIGFRQALYQTQQKKYWSAEPRLSIHYQQDRELSYALSATRMKQFIHLLTTSGVGFSNDVWVPATSDVPPQAAQQIALSASKKWSDALWELQVEAFYKTMDEQIDYRRGIRFFFSENASWEQAIEKKGIGRAYGFELFLRKQAMDSTEWSGWLSYTLSKSERKFANINDGTWYPHRYDRRHQLSIVAEKRLNRKWTFSTNFILSTGHAVTMPDVAHFNLKGTLVQEIYEKRNNQRMPLYNRMDIAFVKNYLSKKKKQPRKVSYSIYNVYGYPNAFALDYFAGDISTGHFSESSTIGFNGTASRKLLFLVIPGFNYAISF